MKKHLLLFICLLFVFISYRTYSQNLVQNPGFESVNSLPFNSTNCARAFEGQSLNWYSTHGSPHLRAPNGVSCSNAGEPRNGNYSAVMVTAAGGVVAPYSEDIFQSINFTSGKVYKILGSKMMCSNFAWTCPSKS